MNNIKPIILKGLRTRLGESLDQSLRDQLRLLLQDEMWDLIAQEICGSLNSVEIPLRSLLEYSVTGRLPKI